MKKKKKKSIGFGWPSLAGPGEEPDPEEGIDMAAIMAMTAGAKNDPLSRKYDALMTPPTRSHRDAKRFDDDFDAIYDHYTKGKKLSLVQSRQLARWKFARQWYSDYDPYNDAEVVEALRRQFGISTKQAYTDIKNCKKFFASVDVVNEEFEKVMHIERIRKLRQKSIELGTDKGYLVAARCDQTLSKIHGFEQAKEQLPQPVIAHVFIDTNPELVGALPIPNLELEVKNFWRKKKEDAEAELNVQDVDYEDLVNNPRNEHEHGRSH